MGLNWNQSCLEWFLTSMCYWLSFFECFSSFVYYLICSVFIPFIRSVICWHEASHHFYFSVSALEQFLRLWTWFQKCFYWSLACQSRVQPYWKLSGHDCSWFTCWLRVGLLKRLEWNKRELQMTALPHRLVWGGQRDKEGPEKTVQVLCPAVCLPL